MFETSSKTDKEKKWWYKLLILQIEKENISI